MTSSDAIPAVDTTLAGIVFDLDGTLIDSAPDIAGAINQMLAGRGLPPQSVEFVERFIGEDSYGLVDNLYKGLGMVLEPARVTADVDAYLAFYRAQPVRRSTLFADALEAIPALHAAGLRLGVCTNKAQQLAEAVLDHFGLHSYFCAIVGGDALAQRKPDPVHLLTTLERMGVLPAQAIFVGDTLIDAECGRRAQVRCMMVDWGTGRRVPVEPAVRLAAFADLQLLCENTSVSCQPEKQ